MGNSTDDHVALPPRRPSLSVDFIVSLPGSVDRWSKRGPCSVSHAVPALGPALWEAWREEHRGVRSDPGQLAGAHSPVGRQDLPSTERVSGLLVSLETLFSASQAWFPASCSDVTGKRKETAPPRGVTWFRRVSPLR